MSRSHKMLYVTVSIAFLAIATPVINFIFLEHRLPLFAPSPEQLVKVGAPLVDALEQYRKEHGRYPESLELAEIVNIETHYGKFLYRVSDDGTNCYLQAGDYGEYLFEVYWYSSKGWYIDS